MRGIVVRLLLGSGLLVACNTNLSAPGSSIQDGQNRLTNLVQAGPGIQRVTPAIADNTAYKDGVAVESGRSVVLPLNGQCVSFSSGVALGQSNQQYAVAVQPDFGTTGVNPSNKNAKIVADGKVIAEMPLLQNTPALKGLRLDGVKTLELQAEADVVWAGASLECRGTKKIQTLATSSTELDSVYPWGETIAVDTYIAFDFLDAMNRESVNINITPALANAQLTWINDNYLILQPSNPMQGNTTYTVAVTGQSQTGATLGGNLATWSFTTAATPAGDFIAPKIGSVYPWGQSIEASSYVALAFTEPMNTNNFQITVNPPVELQLDLWNTPDTYARFIPKTPLRPDTVYTVSMSGKDVAGNALAGATTWQFKTAGAVASALQYRTMTFGTPFTDNFTESGFGSDNQNNWYVKYGATDNTLEVYYNRIEKLNATGQLVWRAEFKDLTDGLRTGLVVASNGQLFYGVNPVFFSSPGSKVCSMLGASATTPTETCVALRLNSDVRGVAWDDTNKVLYVVSSVDARNIPASVAQAATTAPGTSAWIEKYDANLNKLSEKQLVDNAPEVQFGTPVIDPQGRVYVPEIDLLSTPGGYNVKPSVLKLDAGLLAAQSIGLPETNGTLEWNIALQVAPNGSIYSVRHFRIVDLPPQTLLSKITPQGVLAWDKDISTINDPNAAAGDVLYLASTVYNPIEGVNGQLERFDTNRGLVWTRSASIATTFNDHFVGLDGTVHVLGSFQGSIGNIPSNGNQDGMILHYDSNGNPINQTN